MNDDRCFEPGIYNDSETFIPAGELPDWRWMELADSNRYCTLPRGHSGMHRDGSHGWGRMQDLSLAEKLEVLGIDEDEIPL